MPVIQKLMTVFVCERCEHEWVPRDPDTLPTVCPKCKSPYWNKPRINPVSAKRKRASVKRRG